MRVLLLTLFAFWFVAPSVRGDAYEADLREVVGRLPPVEQETLAKAAYGGHYALDQLVGFSNWGGRLYATFRLPPELVRRFRDPAPLLVSLEGSRDVWSLERRKSGTLDPGLSLVTLTCYAAVLADRWRLMRYAISSDGAVMRVSTSELTGGAAGGEAVTLIQGERSLSVAWRFAADRFVLHEARFDDLAQVEARAPADVMARHLLPALRRLGPARPGSDVYRVFDQIPADPRAARQVRPVLARLDADDPATRDAASRRLRAMGRAATLACLRMDSRSLSPEQRTRLAAHYDADGWVHVSDVEAARHDPVFLTACLADEDPAVRTAAANLLAAVQVGGGR
jgi:hypothetical protein